MKILFIGNSHTYTNALPYQVRAMIQHTAGPSACDAWMLTCGGKSIGWHAQEVNTRMNLLCNPWDYVVLQQNSHPFGGYEQLASDVAALRPDLVASGAKILLYVTWKRRDAPEEDQLALNDAFARVGKEIGATLIPAGSAWAAARQTAPEIELYNDDGSHAAPAGTYLTACLFHRLLTGRTASGLPARIAVGDTVLADLTPATAATLQAIADAQSL